MSYLEKKLNSKKIFLFIAMAAVLFADLFVAVTLIGFGLSFGSLAVVLLLTVLDLAFIAIAVFTNFRFTYSLKYVIGYSAAAFTLVLIFALANSGAMGKSIVMSLVAATLWAGVHVLFGAAFASAVMTASSDGGKAKLTSALLTALAVVGVIGYSGFVIGSGVYGQGYAEMARTVVYEYDSEGDYYVAVGALSGKGHELKVPESFNGKPVGAVDASLFIAAGLDKIDLTGAVETLKYTNRTGIDYEIDCPEVSLSKESFDTFVRDMVENDDSDLNCVAISILSSLTPSGLSENEVYITFSYTPEVLEAIGKEILPIWIGDKNEVFTLDFASEISYVKKSDKGNEAILKELYDSGAYGGGKILSALVAEGGTSLLGEKISASVNNAAVTFEPIYNIVYTVSNDGLYNASLGNVPEAPRYTTADRAADVIAEFPKREGFYLGFEYDGEKKTVDEAIAASLDTEILVTPVYDMKPPKLDPITADKANGVYTYGDAMLLSGSAEPVAEGFTLTYEWYLDSYYLGGASDYSDDLVNYDEGGRYVLQISQNHPDSSLDVMTSVYFDVTFKKKPLAFTFGELADGFTKVYDAAESYITVSYDESSVEINDIISYGLSVESVLDAGEYKTELVLKSDTQYKYEPTVSSAVYTVYPKELEIEWTSDTEFVYNGTLQHRAASIISGICSTDEVSLTYSGFDKNAGEKTAVLGTSNPNYSVRAEDKERPFTVSKAPLTVEWTPDSLEMVYNATATRKPVIERIGGIFGDEKVTASVNVISPSKNVGVYEAKAELGATTVNANYYIQSGADVTFEITPKPVTLSFTNTSLTYNGLDNRLPTVTVSGVIGTDDVGKSVTSNAPAKNAGDYTATVTLSNNNYCISGESSASFNIKKADVVLYWGSPNLTYDGTEQAPSHYIKSGIVAGESFTVLISGKARDASEEKRTAIASLVAENGELAENYNITNPTYDFIIKKRIVQIFWTNDSVVYNGEEQTVTVSNVANLVTGDDAGIITDTYRDVGEYVVYARCTNPNYVPNSDVGMRFNITRAPLAVSWSESEYTYDGESHRPTAAITSGVHGSDAVNLITEGASEKNAGSYKVSVKPDNDNYYVTPATSSITYRIKPRPIEISVSGLTVGYTASPQSARVEITSGLIGSDDAGITLQQFVNAGSHKTGVTLTNGNYVFAEGQSTSFTLVIEKAPITVSWSRTEMTYNGAEQIPIAYVSSGKLGNDSINLSVDGKEKNAGTYTASVRCQNGNYYINGESTVSYTIAKKEITLVYGASEVPYNGEAQKPSYTVSGVVGADNPGVSFGGLGADVGVYSVSASVSNTNYQLSEASKHFSMKITPRTLQVYLVDTSLVYNGSVQMPRFEVLGAVNSSHGVSLTLVGAGVDVGRYQVIPTTDNPNYQISTTNPQLFFEIVKKTLTVSWAGGSSYTEDGSPKTPTPICKDALGNDVEGTVTYYAYNGSGWVSIVGAPINAGRYKAVFIPDYTPEENYEYASTSYEFTVKEASGN